jgi:hypothetical protein
MLQWLFSLFKAKIDVIESNGLSCLDANADFREPNKWHSQRRPLERVGRPGEHWAGTSAIRQIVLRLALWESVYYRSGARPSYNLPRILEFGGRC